eukprot:jgi/Botrbrau1/19153/Bobra.0077s0065.1
MALSQEEDWPREVERRSELKSLDDAARCSICHDIFQVPLSLPCGHSFCSGCIRGNFEFQERTDRPKCPQCRKPATAQDLRPNIALGGFSSQYLGVRSLLVGFAIASTRANPRNHVPNKATKGTQAPNRASEHGQAAEPTPRPLTRPSSRRPTSQREKEPPADKGPAMNGRVLRKRRHSPRGHAEEDSTQDAAEGGAESPSCLGDDGDFVVDLRDSDTSPAVTPVKRPKVGPPAGDRAGGAGVPNGTSTVPMGASALSAELCTDALLGKTPETDSREAAGREDSAAGTRGPSEGPRGPPGGPEQPAQPGYVQCPACGMTIREAILNLHLDKCLDTSGPGPAKPRPSAKPRKGGAAFAGAGARLKSPRRLAVPPSIVFPLIKDGQLKEKLRALGLPISGKRAELEQRYRDFRIAVQKANDAGEETSYQALAQQYKARLAAAGLSSSHAPVPSASITDGDGTVLDITGASFEDLIRATREREGRSGPSTSSSAREVPSVGPMKGPMGAEAPEDPRWPNSAVPEAPSGATLATLSACGGTAVPASGGLGVLPPGGPVPRHAAVPPVHHAPLTTPALSSHEDGGTNAVHLKDNPEPGPSPRARPAPQSCESAGRKGTSGAVTLQACAAMPEGSLTVWGSGTAPLTGTPTRVNGLGPEYGTHLSASRALPGVGTAARLHIEHRGSTAPGLNIEHRGSTDDRLNMEHQGSTDARLNMEHHGGTSRPLELSRDGFAATEVGEQQDVENSDKRTRRLQGYQSLGYPGGPVPQSPHGYGSTTPPRPMEQVAAVAPHQSVVLGSACPEAREGDGGKGPRGDHQKGGAHPGAVEEPASGRGASTVSRGIPTPGVGMRGNPVPGWGPGGTSNGNPGGHVGPAEESILQDHIERVLFGVEKDFRKAIGVISNSDSEYEDACDPPAERMATAATVGLDGAGADSEDEYELPDAPYGCSQPPPPAPSRPVLRSMSRFGG